MFPIYVCWDNTVTLSERRIIEQGMRETQPLFGSRVICYGAHSWSVGKYKNANELVRSTSRRENGQINGSELLGKLSSLLEEWPEPGAIVLITGKDLYGDSCDWCFGLAKMSARVTVQSMSRYRELDEIEKSKCIRHILRHELGHIFYCAWTTKRTNTIEKIGAHCTNPGCSMRQTMSLSELRLAVISEDPKKCFCAQCMNDLRSFKSQYEALEKRNIAWLPTSSNRVASAGASRINRR